MLTVTDDIIKAFSAPSAEILAIGDYMPMTHQTYPYSKLINIGIVTGHSSLRISSEHASAGACSAFCYDIGKHIGIIPIIVAIGKLRQVQRQVLFAHLMECSDHATLQQN